ncbi:MAG TPA: hypothetical protein VFU57_11630, partial [Candidatus Acidoferrales bacterium]|nr:hypothetical protein [Candidatus Acidoferrales bacterium]
MFRYPAVRRQRPYDKRYRDVLEPAVKEAELEPYRVDRDPSVAVPIDDIEKGIRESEICLADITTDNPNVWYEVGFAFANSKPVVLICAQNSVLPPQSAHGIIRRLNLLVHNFCVWIFSEWRHGGSRRRPESRHSARE